MRTVLASVLALGLIALPVMAASPAAVIHGNGQVTVNGTDLSRSTTVFSGDQIRTGDGAGTISAPGASVLVHKSSQVIFGKDGVDILSGGATVKTSNAFAGRILGVNVAPIAKASRFTMTTEADKIYISALEGSLLVGGKISVPEGQMLVLSASAPQPQSDCVDNKKVDGNGKFMVDNVGRFISCIDQTSTGGGPVVDTTQNHIGRWTAVGFGAAGAAGAISGAIIAQENKTDQ